MTSIAANDARTRLIDLIDRAKQGEQTTITTNGDPMARIAPIAPTHDVEAARAAFARIR
jgi:prevent-host-death family protein